MKNSYRVPSPYAVLKVEGKARTESKVSVRWDRSDFAELRQRK